MSLHFDARIVICTPLIQIPKAVKSPKHKDDHMSEDDGQSESLTPIDLRGEGRNEPV